MIIGLLLQDQISFSRADGVFTDELLSFNAEEIDPVRDTTSTYLFDATNSTPNFDLFSDANLNDDNEHSDMFDVLANSDSDINSDLFISDVNMDPTIDPTSFDIVDCGSINNDVLRRDKDARVRRQTVCPNPHLNSDPSLSLPTLDQVNREDPLRPKTEEERKKADAINKFFWGAGSFLKVTDILLRVCHMDEQTICSSGNRLDILLEYSGETFTLLSSTTGMCLSLPALPKTERKKRIALMLAS